MKTGGTIIELPKPKLRLVRYGTDSLSVRVDIPVQELRKYGEFRIMLQRYRPSKSVSWVDNGFMGDGDPFRIKRKRNGKWAFTKVNSPYANRILSVEFDFSSPNYQNIDVWRYYFPFQLQQWFKFAPSEGGRMAPIGLGSNSKKAHYFRLVYAIKKDINWITYKPNSVEQNFYLSPPSDTIRLRCAVIGQNTFDAKKYSIQLLD